VKISLPVRVMRWEAAAACVGVALAMPFLFSNVSGIGVGLLFACALWVVARVRIVERPGAPGRYARLRGALGLTKVLLIFGVYGAVVYGLFIVHVDAPRLRVGVIADVALAGLAFLLLREIRESGNDAMNWLVGARAEKRVGLELAKLESPPWFVLHGYKRDWGGDIDHIVCGPTGVFSVETKSYGFRRFDLRRTAWNAAWLKEKLGVSWVTGVLCVNETRAPTHEGAVWVMGHDELLPWLRRQRQATLDSRVARDLLAPQA
jgi:hypothetical protein